MWSLHIANAIILNRLLSTEKAMFTVKQLNERCDRKSVCVNEIVTCSKRKVTDIALITIPV